MNNIRTRLVRGFFFVVASLIMVVADAAACPVCFGNEESAEVEGAKWAILFLLGVTGTVLTAVVAFVLYVRKRAKMTLNGRVDMPSSN